MRSCSDCAAWMYNDEPGGDRERKISHGGPVPRGGTAPPCWTCPKTAGLPWERRNREHATNVSDAVIQVYVHYRECRAVGQFPDDPIVRRHAAIIRAVEDDQQERLSANLELLVSLLMGKR